MKRGEIEQFTITTITGKRGKTYLITGYRNDGTRIRKRHKTKAEANAHKRALTIEAMNMKEARQPKLTSLTKEQIEDAQNAVAILGEGFTLTGAVDFFNKNYKEVDEEASVFGAVEQFMSEKMTQNLRADTIQNLRSRTNKLVRAFPDHLVKDVTEVELQRLVHDNKLAPKTRNNDLTIYREFFGWCTKKHYAAENIASRLGKVKIENAEPEVLTIDQSKAILRAARDFKKGKMLPIVTASLLCGLRPTEAKLATWEKVDLEERIIVVTGGTAKKRKRRIVEIPKNAVLWFQLCPTKRGFFLKANYRKDLAAIRKLAGWRPERLPKDPEKRKEAEALPRWVKDYMRHTAISMRHMDTEDENATALWAGTSPDMIHTAYRGLVKKADAKTFWSITPDNVDNEVDNVVSMAAS